jgi:4-hydroxybenzoate polyprenyltransferase
MSSASALLRALRPQQWVKNLFVLAALVFARGEHGGQVFAWGDDARRTLLALLAFCLGSSAIYLVNDVHDVENDRRHPEKKNRPIAAGELPIPLALFCAGVLLVSAVALGLAADGTPQPVAWILGAYLVLNLLYSWRLKHIVLVDAFCIAAGFLLRVKAGGAAAGAAISHWLMLCTLFLALFLALAKRRAELELLGEERGGHRASLLEYDTGFLDQLLSVLAACAIVTYTMYTVAPETALKFGAGNHLVYTVPFVVFGLARYQLLVHTQKGGGNPTRLFLGGDLLFGLNTLGWMATVLWCVAQAHAA